MAAYVKQLLLTVIHFLREENLIETAHTLEKETGLYFDTNYFTQLVVDGNFDQAEDYLSGFTKIHDHVLSTRVYFEIRRQKYLEALDRKDKKAALQILLEELQAFTRYNEKIFREAVFLLPLENFRQHESLAMYGDPRMERIQIINVIRRCLEENPLFIGKLNNPFNGISSLRQLVLRDAAETGSSSSSANNSLSLQL